MRRITNANSWRMELSLLPKSPLRGFSDAVVVLIFLVLVLIVALAYLLSRWIAGQHFDGPGVGNVAFLLRNLLARTEE